MRDVASLLRLLVLQTSDTLQNDLGTRLGVSRSSEGCSNLRRTYTGRAGENEAGCHQRCTAQSIAAVPLCSVCPSVMGHFTSCVLKPTYGAPGVDEGVEDEQDRDEVWTTDDEAMEEAEQISKAKSMAAVLKSSKGIPTTLLPAHSLAACLRTPPPLQQAQREKGGPQGRACVFRQGRAGKQHVKSRLQQQRCSHGGAGHGALRQRWR